jgi:predicted alpha/beta superfamily hydrolase
MNRRILLAALASQPIRSLADQSTGKVIGPYSLSNTEVHSIPDPKSGRAYEAWVDLPKSYSNSDRRFPVVYVTDAPYAFPLIRSIRARVGQSGRNLEDFILIGLAAPASESSAIARLRDYTPTDPRARANGSDDYEPGSTYGGAPAYLEYIASVAFPYLESKFRIATSRRTYIGHSYGGLLGAFALVNRPELVGTYVLSSPSLWFDRGVLFDQEQREAKRTRDIKANVLMYCGAFETIKPGPRYFKTKDLVRDMKKFASQIKDRRYASLQISTETVENEDHFTSFPTVATRSLLRILPGKGPYLSG